MKLKSISIKGFKSFAERTDIEFPEGITIIVGPNGSGKSNIADALRWVFGEMSWKNLRGEKMEDVIYQGSKNRSPLGFAEVEIVLDNSDKFLPLEYNEVSILRKLYRSGESIFMLNHKEVRAKDIRTLLMDTGIGKDGYSIIGQGRIDNILSERPEERRSVFEEVAGIAKYKARKVEAERKLSRTSDNLERINDILNEIKNSYENIKIEAKRTRDYQKAFEELKNIDLILSMREYNKLTERINEILSTLKERELEILERESERKALQVKYSELKEKIEESKTQEEVSSKECEALRKEREEISKEASVRENTLTFYNKEITRLRAEIEKSKAEIKILTNNKTEYEENYLKTNNHYEALTQEREMIKNKLGGVDIENKIKEENYLKEELIKVGKNLEILKERIKFNEKSLDENEFKIIETKEYIELKKNSTEELKELLRDISEKTDKVYLDLERNEKSLNNSLERMKVLEEERGVLAKEKEDAVFLNNSLQSELNALKKMEENYEGYLRPVKFLMSLSNREARGILGTVSELFKVEQKFQVAIENALGGQLQNVVVKKDTDAEALIKLLKDNRAGRMTFLPLNRIESRNRSLSDNVLNAQGIFGLADSLIEFDEVYKNIFSNLLGNTLVVDHLKTALALPKEDIKYIRIITLEGEVISAQGAITGGYYNTHTGLLSRRNKIEDIKAKIAKGSLEIKKIEENIALKDSATYEINKGIEGINSEIERLKRDNENELREKERAELRYQSESDLLKSKNEELNSLRAKDEKIKIDLQSLKAQKEDEHSKESSLNKDLERVINLMGKDREKRSHLTQTLNELELRLQNTKHNLERITENKERTEKDLDELIKERERKNKEIISTEENYSKEQQTLKAKHDILNEVLINLEQRERERGQYKLKSETMLKELYELQKTIEENSEYRNEFEKKTSELKLRETRTYAQRESLSERIKSDYSVDIETLEITDEGDTIKNMMERLDSLKYKINEIGIINPKAPEEEKRLSERLDMINLQKEDLIQGKSDLENLINQIESKMSEEFMASMDEVAKNFDTLFKKFFGGGLGTLRLIDKENPLTSGIDILVTLPSKRAQSISLLSGGERSLTAIALLFAIQKIKPTPFCILDEIDAALDDANIQRFTNYLENSLDHVQFILVSHRKKTMEIADTIYGVSMGDDGVSTLLSMRLEESNYKEVR